MLIERAAHASRWRDVAPSAKALLALCGMAAAMIARQPVTLAMLAALSMLVALLRARVALRLYAAALLPPLGFVAVSCATMLVDLPGMRWNADALPAATLAALRALAMLTALLGLTLTTPLPHLLSLLRRLRVPDVLLDLMALCYRMLFVLRQAWDEGIAAQASRLGYARTATAWRSLGLLTAQMAVQVWTRAAALEAAAQARGYDGRLRFLSATFPHAGRQNACALSVGVLMLGVAIGDRW